MTVKLLWLVAAGGAGTVARYGLSGLVHRWYSGAFPWGTLAVNVLGSLIFGLLWSLAQERLVVNADIRTAALVGFAGGFTIFSTFAFETSQLLRDGAWWIVAANVGAQIGLGIAALFIGLALGRLL
jgi:CrcB protein